MQIVFFLMCCICQLQGLPDYLEMLFMNSNFAKKMVKKQLKEYPKNEHFLKIYSPSDHPRCTVDEFVSSSEQIWRNSALHHWSTNGYSAVNGCRQNESKQLIKSSQKSTSNPHHSSPSINILSSEKLLLARKKIYH